MTNPFQQDLFPHDLPEFQHCGGFSEEKRRGEEFRGRE